MTRAGHILAEEISRRGPVPFHRFMENPVKTDPGCSAKVELVTALHDLDCAREEVFLQGLRHVQKEPGWGPPVDTAAVNSRSYPS